MRIPVLFVAAVLVGGCGTSRIEALETQVRDRAFDRLRDFLSDRVERRHGAIEFRPGIAQTIGVGEAGREGDERTEKA